MKTTITLYQAQSAFDLYLSVLAEVGQKPASGPDISHSALLQRCLQNKPVFHFEPPKAFSYPCYSLAEGEPVTILALYTNEEGYTAVNQYRYKCLPNGLLLDERSGLRFRLLLDGSGEEFRIPGVIMRADLPSGGEHKKWRRAWKDD